jgi:hypothetical protein
MVTPKMLLVLDTLRTLGNVFDEQTLLQYLEDPWVTGAPQVVDKYLHGDCDAFAIAVNEATGWPMYAFTEERLLCKDQTMRLGVGLVHAFVSTNHCLTIFDIKGERPFSQALQDYGLPDHTQAVVFRKNTF